MTQFVEFIRSESESESEKANELRIVYVLSNKTIRMGPPKVGCKSGPSVVVISSDNVSARAIQSTTHRIQSQEIESYW